MSGQDGNRGYLIQTVIALLESLDRSDWGQLTIEPTYGSDKIDILWSGASATRVCQVKSSINQINQPAVKKWAAELEAQSTADELTLILVGPCSSAVARMGSHGKVAIPCPRSPNFEEMLGFTAHLLDRFLVREKIHAQSPSHREIMVHALVTKLSIFASDGSPIERHKFVELLKIWVKDIAAPTNLSWELVDFSHQRGIENAIAGKRLGPADVDQCPEFPICKQVVIELKRSHWYSIVGKPGCGKSITAWQAAKKFHDVGYSVWRPHYNAEADELLKSPPKSSLSLLVIDDAQQFGSGFVERLSEYSCETLKVIFTSTLADIVTPNPSCISPKSGIDKLKTSMLERRAEILPIVQRFDNSVSDKYLHISFERRIDECASEETPWEFFWVLRGGWRTARTEYEGLQQVPNANALLTMIALRQISSCDAGVSRNKLLHISGELGLTVDETDGAISYLDRLELVLILDGIFRTKHISYAYRIVEESLRNENRITWPRTFDILIATILDGNTSLKGVYWLLCAINLTDAIRFGDQEKLQPVLEPLMSRCRDEWPQSEWAIGCTLRLSELLELSIVEMLADEELLLNLFTTNTGKIFGFSSHIANKLIFDSDKEGRPETTDSAKSIFEKIDLARLVELANSITLDDFYSFGDLLDRLAFYRPSWLETFLSKFDWPRMLKIILNADASHAYAVEKLVGSVSLLSSIECGSLNLQYIADIVPFVVRAISTDPINIIASMDNLFWDYLGLAPRSFRGGADPNEEQIQIAQNIVAQLDPADFALSMKHIISRDMESLARSLSVICEVDPKFISRVASLVPEEDFHITARSDWRTQSSELTHLLGLFCIGEEQQPARNWVSRNEQVIEGPLEPTLAGVAPQVAVNFFKAGRGVNLIERDRQRWNVTVWAISKISDVDKDVCIKIITDQLDELENALYDLTLDSPRYIFLFFRLMHEISSELFARFVRNLKNIDDPRAIKTIDQVVKSQLRERANYEKLARLACQMGGDVGALGKNLLMRLEEASTVTR